MLYHIVNSFTNLRGDSDLRISKIHEAVDEKLESTASYRKYKILDQFDFV